MSEYARRNEILLTLGFKSYKHYLRSPEWKEIRARKLAQDSDCFGCGKPATQVHHEHYGKEILEGTTLVGLWSVCGRCHQFCEFSKSGHKLTPAEATESLKRIHAKYYLPGRKRHRVDNRSKVMRKKTSKIGRAARRA